MRTVMYEGKEVEVIDCTPTWGGMVDSMLRMYVQHSVDAGFLNEQESRDNVANLEAEFRRMAMLADKWVTYQQSKA